MTLKIRFANSDINVLLENYESIKDLLNSNSQTSIVLSDSLDAFGMIMVYLELKRDETIDQKQLELITMEMLKFGLTDSTPDGDIENRFVELYTSTEFQEQLSMASNMMLRIILNVFSAGVLSAYNEEAELERTTGEPSKYLRA